MALRLETFGKALLLALWVAGPLPAAAPIYDAPTGLTLEAQGGGRYLLYWDPIFRDDLQGYSIWLRKPGDREFIRLSVPVKVGKELKKQPLTPESKVVLALGRDRPDLEMAVVAEYEEGSSARTAVVKSGRAALSADLLAAAAPAAQDDGSKPLATASADAPVTATASEGGSARPWDRKLPNADKPLLLPPGKWRTWIGAGYSIYHYNTSGTDLASNAPIILSGVSGTQTVNWQETQVRNILTLPLGLAVGVVPGMEFWAQGALQSENAYTAYFSEAGQSETNFHFVKTAPDGTLYSQSYPNSTGAGDVALGLKVKPFNPWPFVLGLKGTLPTGVSRFQSYLDTLKTNQSPAGTGEGVVRLAVSGDLGWSGQRPGLAFRVSYEPAATETFDRDYAGVPWHVVLVHGDVTEGGLNYTFPWTLMGQEGGLVLGMKIIAVGADQWTINGGSPSKVFGKSSLSRAAPWGQALLLNDDQMEASVSFDQRVMGGYDTGGKLAYTSEYSGDMISISGQLMY